MKIFVSTDDEIKEDADTNSEIFKESYTSDPLQHTLKL